MFEATSKSQNLLETEISMHSLQIKQELKNSQNQEQFCEGELTIITNSYLQLNKYKTALSIFLIIITGGIFGLVITWSVTLKKYMFFTQTNMLKNSTHILVENIDKTKEIQKLQFCKVTDTYYFYNRQMKYSYKFNQILFLPLNCVYLQKTSSQILEQDFQPMNDQQIQINKSIYGQCIINLPNISFIKYMLKEITQPYYFIVYFVLFAWLIQGNIILAIIFYSATIMFPIINFFLIKKSNKKMKQLVQQIVNVNVYRGETQNFEFSQTIESTELVPGDIIEISENMKIPCDCIILSGELLVNEESLSGESLPVPKYNLEKDQLQINIEKQNKKNTILQGTTIVQTKPNKHQSVLALVIRTGYSSQKGQMFRPILYPLPKTYQFYRQILIFCLILLSLAMFVGIYYAYIMKEKGFQTWVIIMTYMQIVIQNLPPAFPIFANSTCTTALLKLKRQKIQCMDVHKILPASNIDVACFDKTGTLTRSDLQFHSYLDKNFLQFLKEDIKEKDQKQLLFKAFASCHQIHILESQHMGDALDIAMFKFSEWSIDQNVSKTDNLQIKFQVSHEQSFQTIQILKIFEFESELQRMTVIIKDLSNKKYYSIVKGSPEIVQQITNNNQNEQMTEQIQQFGLQGLRIISFGFQELSEDFIIQDQIIRDGIENNLQFLGMMAFQNELKSDSKDSIQKLQEGNVNCKVISGDNPLTTIQTAKECSIVQKKEFLLFTMNEQEQLERQIINNKYDAFDQKIQSKQIKDINKYSEIGITGKALEYLINGNEQEQQLLQQIIQKGQIFARMKPDQKSTIIKLIQQQNKKVCMIGDGANDCAAIKQADVGVSFNACDAGLSATFTADGHDSISIVVYILKIGKTCMQIVIDILKIMLVYGMLSFMASFYNITNCSIFGNAQNLYLFAVVYGPIYLLAYSGPCQKLSPIKVEDNFLSPQIYLTFFNCVIFGLPQFYINYIYTYDFDDFREQSLNKDSMGGFNLNGDVVSAMFLTIINYFPFVFLVLTINQPFKQPLYKQYGFFISLIVLVILNLIITFLPKFGSTLLSLSSKNYTVYNNFNFRFQIWGFCTAIGIFMWTVQQFINSKIGERKREKDYAQQQQSKLLAQYQQTV